MRLAYRFATLIISIILITFICWNIPTYNPLIKFHKFQGKIPHRIVSFGDSYSNNPPLQFALPASNSRIYEKVKRDVEMSQPEPEKDPNGNGLIAPPPGSPRDPGSSFVQYEVPKIPASLNTPASDKPATEKTTSTPPSLPVGGYVPPNMPPGHPPIVGNPKDFDGVAPGVKKPVEDLPDIRPPTVWTSLLCYEELACDVHHNFASAERVGVDKSVYLNNITVFDAGADLKEQVQKWIEFEEKEKKNGRSRRGETLFTVWFGISDIMKFSVLSRKEAIGAVDASLDSLFDQLTVISENWSKSVKIFIPYAIDVSLLPAYTPLLQPHTPGFTIAAEIQKNAIFLTSLWNQGLELHAKQWTKGQLVVWDVNDWFLSELRAGKELKQNEGGPVKTGGWENVKEACVGHRRGKWELCDDPEGHLMWDEFRLGPRAHRRIAKQAMSLVKETWPTMKSFLHSPSPMDVRALWQGGGGVL